MLTHKYFTYSDSFYASIPMPEIFFLFHSLYHLLESFDAIVYLYVLRAQLRYSKRWRKTLTEQAIVRTLLH